MYRAPYTVPLSDIAVAAARHLGDAEHYRVWCVTQEGDLNQFRRLEFYGWLVGWNEGLSGGTHPPHSRTEVSLYLTIDGRIIATVNLFPGAVRQILGSPPDCWAMFLGDHGSLEAAELWLKRVRSYVGEVMTADVGAAAIARTHSLLSRIGRTTEREAAEHRKRSELLARRHATEGV